MISHLVITILLEIGTSSFQKHPISGEVSAVRLHRSIFKKKKCSIFEIDIEFGTKLKYDVCLLLSGGNYPIACML